MPQYQISVPGQGTFEVNSPTELTDEQAYAAIRHQLRNQPKPKGGFAPALSAGWENLKGDMAAVAGKTGLMSLPAAEQYRAERAAKADATFKPTEEGWTDAPWTKFKETLGGSLPYMAAPLAAGAAAAAAPVSAPLAAGLGMGAAGLTSAAQFTGSNLSRQVQEGKTLEQAELGPAAAAAVPQAALDMVGFKMIPGIRNIFKAAGKELSPIVAKKMAEQSLREVAKDYALSTGKAMGVEGLTEAGQQVFERLQAGLNITDPQARKEYFDNFVGGAVLGGALSPAGRFHERGQEKALEAKADAEERKKVANAGAWYEQQQADTQEIRRQQPEYAQQVEEQYLAAEQKLKDLQAQIKKVDKNSPTAAADRAENKAIGEELRRVAKEEVAPLAQEYRSVKQALAKDKADKAAAAEQQRIAGLTPEEFAYPADPAAPAAEPEHRYVGMEEKYAAPLTPAQQYAQQQLETAKYHLHEVTPKDAVEYLMQDPGSAQKVLEERVVLPGLSIKQNEAVLGALKLQLKQRRDTMLRTPGAGAANINTVEAEEQAALEQQRAEQERIAQNAQSELATAQKVFPEIDALRRIGDKPSPVTQGMTAFGSESDVTPSSPAIGQMQQKLTGEDVTHTAEPAPKTAPATRGEKAPFRLFPSVDGKEAPPITRGALVDRLDRLALRKDLTKETAMYLQRLQRALPANDTQGLFDILDRQLQRIEQGLEGVARPGARKPVDLLTAAPADATANVAPPTEAAPEDIAAYAQSPNAKAYARKQRAAYLSYLEQGKTPAEAGRLTNIPVQPEVAEKYQAMVAMGLTKQQAAARSRLIFDPDEVERSDKVTVANKMKRVDDVGPETLRGPSAAPADLSLANEIEPHLKFYERAGVDEGRQGELFSESGITPRGAVKATPEEFKRFMSSPFVRKLQKKINEAEALIKRDRQKAKLQEKYAMMEYAAENKVAELTKQLDAALAAQAEYKTADAAVNKVAAMWGGLQVLKGGLRNLRNLRDQMEVVEKHNDSLKSRVQELDNAKTELESKLEEIGEVEPGLREQLQDELTGRLTKTREALNEIVEKHARTQQWLETMADKVRGLEAHIKIDDLRSAAPFPYEIDALQNKLRAQRGVLTKAEDAAAAQEVGIKKQEAAAHAELVGRTSERAKVVKELSEGRREIQQKEQEVRQSLPGARIRQLTPEERSNRGLDTSMLSDKEREMLRTLKGPALSAYINENFPASQGVAARGFDLQKRTLTQQEVRTRLEYEMENPQEDSGPLISKGLAASSSTRIAQEIGQVEKQLKQITETVKKARAKSASYGGEGTTFKGLGAAIRAQSAMGDRLEALRAAFDTAKARENPRTAAIPVQAKEKTKVSARDQASIDKQMELVQEHGFQKDRVDALTQDLEEAKTAAKKAAIEKRLEVEQNKLHTLRRQIDLMEKGRVSAGARLATSAPGKLRSGSEESQKNPGVSRQPIVERREVQESNRAISKDEMQAANEDAERLKKLSTKETKAEEKSRLALEKELAAADAAAEAQKQDYEDEYNAPSVERNNRASTDLSSDAAEAAKDGRILDVAQDLVDNGSTPEVKATAAKLKPLLMRTKLKVDENVTHNGEKVNGLYSPETNTATLHPEALTEEDTLHEMTHAATDRVLLADPKTLTPEQRAARTGLEGMQRRLVDHPEFKGETIPNVREFVAEVFSNPDLRAKMDRLGKPLTLFDHFKNLIRRLLDRPLITPSSKATDLIDKILQPSRQFEGASTPSAQRTAAADIANDIIAQPKSFKERFGSNLGMSMEMWAVDMRAPLMKALSAAGEKAAQQAAYYIRKADARMSHTYAVLTNGPLQMKKDNKGFNVIEAGNGPSGKEIFDAVSKIPGAKSADKMNLAQVYLTAQRANRVGWDKLGFDADHINALKTKADAMMAEVKADPETEAALKEVSRLYNEYNKGLISFMAHAGALSKADAAELVKHGDYVPFYRVKPDGTAELVLSESNIYAVGNIRTQPYLQQLKGGDQKLLPLNESLIRNTMLLTDMGMRNIATKDAAYALQAIGKGKGEIDPKTGKARDRMAIHTGPGPASPTTIRFKQDGAEYHTTIDTAGTAAEGIPSDMLAHSMEGSFSAMPAFLKVAGWFGDILRSGVTRNPMYIARQLVRDPMAAAFTAGLDSGPLTAVAKSVKEFAAQMTGNSDTATKLLQKGVVHSNIFTGDVDDMSKMALQLANGDQSAYHKFIAGWDAAAMRADASTRAQMYDSAIKQGASELEAEMAAMEMMNFNKRGISPTVQFASRMIPFFNAQIQGLNVLYKAATGNMPLNDRLKIKEKFFKRAMMLAGMTVLYAAAMDDDDTYKNARARDRYGNFFVPNPLGGEHIKIPIPFEVGVLFKALPEAMVDAMKGQFGAQEWKAIRQLFTQQIPGSGSYGVPQVARPILEVVSNANWYTGNQIESEADQRLAPQERFGRNTTELAKSLSNGLSGALSPKQIEHLVNGYLGNLPIAVARMTNSVFASAEANPVTPDSRGSDLPVFGALFQKQYGGGPIDAAYAQAQALEQSANTYKKMLTEGRAASAAEYKENAVNVIASPQLAKRYTSQMAKFKQAEDAIRRSEKDSTRMRERLDILDKQRNDFSKMYLHAVESLAR